MKPHIWDYKLFILAGVSGSTYKIEIYNEQETNIQHDPTRKLNLGASSNIVKLYRIIPLNQNFTVYFDNYYKSLGLLIY